MYHMLIYIKSNFFLVHSQTDHLDFTPAKAPINIDRTACTNLESSFDQDNDSLKLSVQNDSDGNVLIICYI